MSTLVHSRGVGCQNWVTIGSKLVHVVVEWPLMVFARMGYFFSFFARTKKVSDYSKRSLYPQFHQITVQSQYE